MKKQEGLGLIGILIIIGALIITGGVLVWEKKVSPAPLSTPAPAAKFCVPRHGPCEKGGGTGKIWYYSEKDNLCQQFNTYIRCQGSTFATKEECEHACVVEIPQRTEMGQGLYGKVFAGDCMPPGPQAKGLWRGKITFFRVEDEKIVKTVETMVKEGNYKIGLTGGIYRAESSQGAIFPRQIEVQQNQWREQDLNICTSF